MSNSIYDLLNTFEAPIARSTKAVSSKMKMGSAKRILGEKTLRLVEGPKGMSGYLQAT